MNFKRILTDAEHKQEKTRSQITLEHRQRAENGLYLALARKDETATEQYLIDIEKTYVDKKYV